MLNFWVRKFPKLVTNKKRTVCDIGMKKNLVNQVVKCLIAELYLRISINEGCIAS